MTRRGTGHIVFVSSMAAKTPAPGVAVYAATKAALRALALCLREDLHAAGAGVSVVLPGPVSDAGMWADAGLATPKGVRTKPPRAVAAAVITAIEHNRAEIDVACPTLRFGATLAHFRPEWFAALGRRRGAAEYAAALTAAGRDKR